MQDRGMIEGLVLSCIYQDLTLVTELEPDFFSTNKSIFYFVLAREMSKTIKEVDMISVCAWCNTNGLLQVFEGYGGYESINNLLKLEGNVDNFYSYVDDLRKHVLIQGYTELGFDLDKCYELNGEKVKPSEVLPFMDSIQFGSLIQSIFLNVGAKVIEAKDKFESLHYTEEEIEKMEKGELENTAQFDITMTWKDIRNGEDRYLQSFRMLNDELNGVCRKNGVMFIGASSGSGKSTVSLSIILGLIESGEKVLLVSNEQVSKYFKDLLSAYVCINVFKCYTISRKKISKWTLSDTEKEVFFKANEFIKEKYEGKLTFWAVNEFDINKIESKMKKLNMTEGYRYMVLDTFKPTSLESGNVTNEYVELSRRLDTFGRKNDIGIICPIQLLSSTDKLSYLTASQITNAKQIKEIASKILLFRKCRNQIELNPENQQYFLRPFIWQKNEMTGKYEKRYLKIIDSTKKEEKKYEFDRFCVDVSKRHLVFFIDKNRSGSDSLVYLYEFDGNSGRLTEKAICDHISYGVLMQ